MKVTTIRLVVAAMVMAMAVTGYVRHRLQVPVYQFASNAGTTAEKRGWVAHVADTKIGKLEVGVGTFVCPWALWYDYHGRLWVDPESTGMDEAYGTCHVEVIRLKPDEVFVSNHGSHVYRDCGGPEPIPHHLWPPNRKSYIPVSTN